MAFFNIDVYTALTVTDLRATNFDLLKNKKTKTTLKRHRNQMSTNVEDCERRHSNIISCFQYVKLKIVTK